jgi:four helix bundle protein
VDASKQHRSSDEKGLETLQVWQKAMGLTVKVYREVLPLLPPEEKWVLGVQLRRAIQSIAANIAEGFGRYHYQDSIRICFFARGSLEEAFSHLVLARRLDFLPDNQYRNLVDEINELRRMLNGYIAFLRKSKRGADESGSGTLIRDDFVIYEPDNQSDNGVYEEF